MPGIASGVEAGLGAVLQNQQFRTSAALQQQRIGMEQQQMDFERTRQQNADALNGINMQAQGLRDQLYPYIGPLQHASSIDDPQARADYMASDEYKSARSAAEPILGQLNDLGGQYHDTLSKMTGNVMDNAAYQAQNVLLKRQLGASQQITPDEYANFVAYRSRQPASAFLAGPNGEPPPAVQHLSNVAQAMQSGNWDNLHDSVDFFFPQMKAMIGHTLPGSRLQVSDVGVEGAHLDPQAPGNVVLQPRLTLYDPVTKQTSRTTISQYGGHSLSMPMDQAMQRVKDYSDIAQDALKPENQQLLQQGTDFYKTLQSGLGGVGIDPRSMIQPMQVRDTDLGDHIQRDYVDPQGRVAYSTNLQKGAKPIDPSEAAKNNAEAYQATQRGNYYKNGGSAGAKAGADDPTVKLIRDRVARGELDEQTGQDMIDEYTQNKVETGGKGGRAPADKTVKVRNADGSETAYTQDTDEDGKPILRPLETANGSVPGAPQKQKSVEDWFTQQGNQTSYKKAWGAK